MADNDPRPDPWPQNPDPEPGPQPEPPQPARPDWLADRVRQLSRNGRRIVLRRLGWTYGADGSVLLEGGLPRAEFGRLLEMAEEGVRGLPEAFGVAVGEGRSPAIDAVMAACVDVEEAFAELKAALAALQGEG